MEEKEIEIVVDSNPQKSPSEESQDTQKKTDLSNKERTDFKTFNEKIQEIQEKKAQTEKKPTGLTHIAREINRQSTISPKNKLSKEELLMFLTKRTDLSKKEMEAAVVVQYGESILSALEEGIEEGGLAAKVIIALAITLYEQSEIFGTTKDLTGATESLLPLLGAKSMEYKQTPGRSRALNGEKLVKYPCPVIIIDITEFTKLVLGKDEVQSIEKRRIREVLDELGKKKVFLLSEDRETMISTTIIGKQRGAFDLAITKDKDGNERRVIVEKYRVIELDSIFTKDILKDFAVIRKDTLRKLTGRQTLLTMKLLHLLLEKYSYHKGIEYAPTKEDLLSRIAVGKRYNKHPKEIETDLTEAVDIMVKLHLLLPIKKEKNISDPKRGGYYERVNKQSELCCHFVFNPNYENEDDPIEEAQSSPQGE